MQTENQHGVRFWHDMRRIELVESLDQTPHADADAEALTRRFVGRVFLLAERGSVTECKIKRVSPSGFWLLVEHADGTYWRHHSDIVGQDTTEE